MPKARKSKRAKAVQSPMARLRQFVWSAAPADRIVLDALAKGRWSSPFVRSSVLLPLAGVMADVPRSRYRWAQALAMAAVRDVLPPVLRLGSLPMEAVRCAEAQTLTEAKAAVAAAGATIEPIAKLLETLAAVNHRTVSVVAAMTVATEDADKVMEGAINRAEQGRDLLSHPIARTTSWHVRAAALTTTIHNAALEFVDLAADVKASPEMTAVEVLSNAAKCIECAVCMQNGSSNIDDHGNIDDHAEWIAAEVAHMIAHISRIAPASQDTGLDDLLREIVAAMVRVYQDNPGDPATPSQGDPAS